MAGLGGKDTSFEGLPVAAKVFVLVLIVGLLTVVYYVALHMSLSDQISAAEQQYTQLQQQLQQAQQRQQEYLQLSQELANREAIDRRNKMTLPAKAEIASFLQDLNRLAELSGLKIRTVEPRPEEAQNLYVRIPVKLSLTGRYYQLMKFFYNVSQLERAINMEDIALTHPRQEGENLVVDADVMATTFRLPSAQEAAEASKNAKGTHQGGG